jgi:hypothetical protein
MRMSLTRVLAAIGVTLALAAATTTSGLAQVNRCPDGRVGLMVQRADVQVSIICTPVTETPGQIVGLLVRQSDGSARTLDLAADHSLGVSTDATTGEIVGLLMQQSDGSITTIDLAADHGSSTSQSSEVSSSSTLNSGTSNSSNSTSSMSSSSSTSTTCINGQCTTTSGHSVCTDGSCSE